MARVRRMGRRLSTRQLALALLLTASASAISLADFQLISSSSVPLACILAYDAVIPGCSNRDFTQGSSCSSSCVRGLEIIQSAVEAVCQKADVDSNSVLGQAVNGDLVSILCSTGKDSTTAAAAASTTLQTSTTAGAATTTRTIPTFTREASTTSSSSSFSSAAHTTTVEQPSTSSTSSTSATSAETSSSETTTTAAGTTVARVMSSTTTSTSHITSSTHKPEATRGGGSPFDATVTDGTAALGVQWMQKLLLTAICGMFLLR